MKILTIDIGTGTQDIFLYNSKLNVENGYKLILPSPTLIISNKIRLATQKHLPILLTGKTMGGGPSSWAVEGHIKAGLHVYATPPAAKTIHDDLDQVSASGVTIISEEEANALPDSVLRMELKDFDLDAIASVFADFGVDLGDLAAVAVAVFDHGEAPHGVSDRKFRFDYLNSCIRTRNDLRTFAYLPEQIPTAMTRLQAVADSAKQLDVPLIVMDTAPAAVLGATFDPKVCNHGQKLIVNIGNFHTLAFRMNGPQIDGIFEHHTGFLTRDKLETLLLALANGSLQNESVFTDQGHGALIYDQFPFTYQTEEFNLIVTGPRRGMLDPTQVEILPRFTPHFAAPFGDMMITGCFGLLAAVADRVPRLADEITSSLIGNSKYAVAPWDVT